MFFLNKEEHINFNIRQAQRINLEQSVYKSIINGITIQELYSIQNL
jgi:hypothetical protein